MGLKKLLIHSILLSSICLGCARHIPMITSEEDYFKIPKGSTIMIPDKTDIIMTTKNGAFYSAKAQAEVLQARAK